MYDLTNTKRANELSRAGLPIRSLMSDGTIIWRIEPTKDQEEAAQAILATVGIKTKQRTTKAIAADVEKLEPSDKNKLIAKLIALAIKQNQTFATDENINVRAEE